MKIFGLFALEILDSRGFPTIEVCLSSADFRVTASSPSGASVGSLEAFERRDGDSLRFDGRGVSLAVSFVNDVLSGKLIGMAFSSQFDFDSFIISLDGTKNKSKIGGNVLIALSMAFAKLKALDEGIDLCSFLEQETLNLLKQSSFNGINLHFLNSMPVPMMNIINGGKHADNPINIQEFMIMPINCDSFSEAIEMGGNIFHSLKSILRSSKCSINVGDEGGFAPNLKDPREAFELIIKAINNAGYKLGSDILLAIDCAASEFFDKEKKLYKLYSDKKGLNADEMIDFYHQIIRDYSVFSIEDPFSEYDLESAALMTNLMRDKVQIVGDDFFVTNINVFKERQNIGNSILIKPNQIGTVSEAIEMVNYANSNGFSCIASHRSGETEDTFIADFAFGTFCSQIKTGSLCRTDRTCKYNQLLRIENKLQMQGIKPTFNGKFILDKFNKFREL